MAGTRILIIEGDTCLDPLCRHTWPRIGLLELFQIDVAKPDIVSVVLESDVPGSRKILESSPKFIFRAIWILARRCPAIEVGIDDALAVESDLNHRTFASNNDAVPFHSWFDRID